MDKKTKEMFLADFLLKIEENVNLYNVYNLMYCNFDKLINEKINELNKTVVDYEKVRYELIDKKIRLSSNNDFIELGKNIDSLKKEKEKLKEIYNYYGVMIGKSLCNIGVTFIDVLGKYATCKKDVTDATNIFKRVYSDGEWSDYAFDFTMYFDNRGVLIVDPILNNPSVNMYNLPAHIYNKVFVKNYNKNKMEYNGDYSLYNAIEKINILTLEEVTFKLNKLEELHLQKEKELKAITDKYDKLIKEYKLF